MPNSGQIATSFSGRSLYLGFAGFFLACIFTALALQSPWPLLAPPAAIILWLALVDYKLLFYLLFALIPLSTEVVLPNGLGTDLPTEPLIVGLMGIAILVFLRKAPHIDWAFVRHPVSVLLLLHWAWIGFTTLSSTEPLISFKFFLAKTWYITTFYFLAAHILRSRKDVTRLFWVVLIPLLATIIIVMVRHAQEGFSFETIERVLSPFYRNHVNYSAIMALWFPYVWFMGQAEKTNKWIKYLLYGVVILLAAAIYLSYTRAAYIALVSGAAIYLVFRMRAVVPVFLLTIALAIGGYFWLAQRNTYLDLAPNYETTVSHKDFGNLIEATYQMEDISTMERVYRWVAAFHMAADKPFLGFGPNTFVESYRPYTVNSFQTYVSDNPERSGIHSYYLMTMVDQGIPGLVIFLLLNLLVLKTAQNLYHHTRGWTRYLTLMAGLSFFSIMIMQLINDLLETDKVGPFFFLAAAILVSLDARRMSLRRQK